MWIHQLTYENKHDIKHAHYLTYEDACAHMVDIVTPRIDVLFPEEDDKDKMRHFIEFEEWDELLEMWNEWSGEVITIEEYEVFGSEEAAERHNVYAVLSHMTNAVLDENVMGLELKWELGEKIVSTITSTPQLPAEFISFQMTIPGVEDADYSEPEPEDEEPEPKKREPAVQKKREPAHKKGDES